MRRGLTLLEVVLALALLGGLALAAAGWTTLAASSSRDLALRSAWDIAASETLSLIEEDLRLLDESPDRREPRVTTSNDRLIVATRDAAGPCRHTFQLDADHLILERSGEGSPQRSIILGRVRAFDAIDDESGVLTVTLTAHDGRTMTRQWETR